MRATHLQVDYLTEPLGLGNAAPRFFWNAEGGIRQTAFQIVCTRSGETVWDSGKVESASMSHILYAGEPLRSRDAVEWTVTLWDENGEQGEESRSCFELGLLGSEDWSALWISGDYKIEKTRRYPVDCFRRNFPAHGEIANARFYAAARGVYDVTVNGTRLDGHILAPGITDYRRRIQAQTYDVTMLLKSENSIQLRLADGWYRGSSAAYGVVNVYGTQTSVLGQLEIKYTDGRAETIITDRTWDWSNDGPIRFADLKDGEVYNASMSPSFKGKAREVGAPEAILVCSDNVPVTEHERFSPKLLPNKVLDFGQNIGLFCTDGG